MTNLYYSLNFLLQDATDSFFTWKATGQYFLISKKGCQSLGSKSTWGIHDGGLAHCLYLHLQGWDEPCLSAPVTAHFPLTSFPPFTALFFSFNGIVCMLFLLSSVDVNSYTQSLTLGGPALQIIHQSFNGHGNTGSPNTIREPLAHAKDGNMFLQFTDLRCNRGRQDFFRAPFPAFPHRQPTFQVFLSPTQSRRASPPLSTTILVRCHHQCAIQAEFRKIYFDVCALRIRLVGRTICSGGMQRGCRSLSLVPYLIRH